MNRKILLAGVALAMGAGVAPTALAQAKPDDLVKHRLAKMTLQAKYLGQIGGMLKGNVPYNADSVALNATFVENLSRMAWDGFDPSTSSIKSRVKAETYRDMAKFKASADTFEAEAAKLGAAARAKDEAGVRAAFGGVAKVCGSCHDTYREKQ